MHCEYRWLVAHWGAAKHCLSFSDSQKKPFEDVFQYTCFWEFCNVHKKTPVMGLFLVKRDSNTGVCLWILSNSLGHLFLRRTSGGCFGTVRCKRLEHTLLDYTYHRQISRQIFSAFLLASPRDGHALANLAEAQQLTPLASRPVQV